MDNQKDEQDLTVGLDGAMTEGTATGAPAQASDTPEPIPASPEPQTEPEINTVSPPPQDESMNSPEETKPLESNSQGSSGGVVQAPDDSVEMQTPEDPMTAEDTSQYDETEEAIPATKTTTGYNDQSLEKSKKPYDHRNNKKLAVFMTIVVAAILSGGAIYVYVSAQDNAEFVAPAVETLPISEEIQDANNAIEEAILPIDDPVEELPVESENETESIPDTVDPTETTDPAGAAPSTEL